MSGRDLELMARAAALCGLADYGDNTEFRVGLRVILEALDEANAVPELRAALEGNWVANLVTRLRIVEQRRQNPTIANEVIDGPVAVIGLPRTGTTALVDLLAQDPAARAPLQWETANLFPTPQRASWSTDPRIAQLQGVFDQMGPSNPIVALGLHTFGAMLPDECNSFLAVDFWSPNLVAASPLPGYSEWLRNSRPQRPYATHRMILQQLQAHGPAGRWVLKSPFHAFALPELVAEYPDAMLVQTHRDPCELIPSLCGLYSTIRGEGPGDPARNATGQEIVTLWGTALQRCLAARRDGDLNARVFDVSHRSLANDPMGTVRSVYERFDLAYPAQAEQAIKQWSDNPAQHRSSVKFTLADFGLDTAQVETAFGDYRSRFGEFF
jgi:hypothetical protein